MSCNLAFVWFLTWSVLNSQGSAVIAAKAFRTADQCEDVRVNLKGYYQGMTPMCARLYINGVKP
jgi:hypothetical protein